MVTERTAFSLAGLPIAVVCLAAGLALVAWPAWLVWQMIEARAFDTLVLVPLLLWIPVGVIAAGLTVVNPNEARAIVFLGRYTGTVRRQGFWWVNPFSLRPRISVRIRNFETGRLKVNDRNGNPIEIASVVVWRVTDTAEALFEVDDYESYVHVQSEAALRGLAMTYPYDTHDDEEMSLRSSPAEIADQLKTEVQDRLQKAGVEVIETRISHLAYAPEIASVMLRRQQAEAVIAARTRIVEGAVGMVEMALDQLSSKQLVELDEERKASMVSNLLVVLCSEQQTQPVVNAGTLYT
ncbi:MAG: SPFH domain-containing protein [Chloroflexota bacterium]|jgi:regulator of protease activity HflC (stomatin/prohibitin superfamily)|nr:SPFH domain-containing protein [Chloroflexota bacterium]MDH5242521.1 SPFH domain-containing protein [Chloroflexota bacterium]